MPAKLLVGLAIVAWSCWLAAAALGAPRDELGWSALGVLGGTVAAVIAVRQDEEP